MPPTTSAAWRSRTLAATAGSAMMALQMRLAAATTAGDLPARWVIHTVGPTYAKTKYEQKAPLLASCYRESLRVAAELGAATVAFPAISAGIYGWPMDDAARIAVETVRAAAEEVAETVRTVLFVPYGSAAEAAFRTTLG